MTRLKKQVTEGSLQDWRRYECRKFVTLPAFRSVPVSGGLPGAQQLKSAPSNVVSFWPARWVFQ